MSKKEKSGHLVWCALIAMLMARREGVIVSESQENLFITRWFALAKKQRRFSRDVATDIDWVLSQGRSLGTRAQLRHKLDYLWRSYTGELTEQNDLFRLTYAMELAKNHDWVYYVLSDIDWMKRYPSSTVNSIYLLKSAVEENFNNEGEQLNPVPVRIGGSVDGLNELLKSCGWEAVRNTDAWCLMAVKKPSLQSSEFNL